MRERIAEAADYHKRDIVAGLLLGVVVPLAVGMSLVIASGEFDLSGAMSFFTNPDIGVPELNGLPNPLFPNIK